MKMPLNSVGGIEDLMEAMNSLEGRRLSTASFHREFSFINEIALWFSMMLKLLTIARGAYSVNSEQ